MAAQADFQRAFEADSEALLMLDDLVRVVAVSDGYQRATGLARTALHGASPFELPPYRDQPILAQRLRDVLDGVRPAGLSFPVPLEGAQPTSSGTQWTWGYVRPITDGEGRISCFVHGLCTTPPDTQSESRRERRLRKLIEHSYDAIALFDSFGRTTFVSPSVRRMLGYSEAEFAALPPLELIHPDDAASFGEGIRKLFEQPGGQIVQHVRTRHSNGSWRTHEVANWNLLHDPDVNAVVANFHDVTPHVELAQELHRKHEQLQLALSAARAIIWSADIRTREMTFSSDAVEFFGLPPGDYSAGEAALAVVHEDDRAAVLAAAEHSIATDEEFHFEFRGQDVDGERRWFASHGQVIADETGEPARMLGVAWDVTERRVLQEERAALERRVQESQKLESLGVLAGGIAHDFNNLLTAILGNASLLRRSLPPDAVQRRQLAEVEEASRSAAELCRQMLAYAGKGRVVVERSDLNRLIQETTQLLRSSIGKKAELRCELDPELPRVVIDTTQIRQVLMNLVINASDAIGNRSGAIAIHTGVTAVDSGRARRHAESFGTELAAGEYVYLQVRDTGPGVPDEHRARIFEPFFSTKFTGRGLGLATVLGIARGHRGGVELENDVGRGARFSVLLPFERKQTPSEPVPAPATSHAPARGQGTILVADDEPSVRMVTSEALGLMGFAVLAAANGREALALYREHRAEIVCVLLDLTMPEVDGEEAFAELRLIDPAVRVLLMSGYDEQEAFGRFIGKGMAGFIHKPFDFDQLDRKIRALLT